MLQIFDNLFHYKNIVTLQCIKRLKLSMVTMATLLPAKELKIQVVSWQNEIRTLDVLKSPTWLDIPNRYAMHTLRHVSTNVCRCMRNSISTLVYTEYVRDKF